MRSAELFDKFHEIAANPAKQMEQYLSSGKKVVLMAPVYTPEGIIQKVRQFLFLYKSISLHLQESLR